MNALALHGIENNLGHRYTASVHTQPEGLMKNFLLATTASLGLALTANAGTISFDSTSLTLEPQELSSITIDSDALAGCLEAFTNSYILTVDGQTTTLTCTEETLAFFEEMGVPESARAPIVVSWDFVDTSAVVTVTQGADVCTVIFSDASELPDLTTKEGLALFYCYVAATAGDCCE